MRTDGRQIIQTNLAFMDTSPPSHLTKKILLNRSPENPKRKVEEKVSGE